jgi:hypothetical protein
MDLGRMHWGNAELGNPQGCRKKLGSRVLAPYLVTRPMQIILSLGW